MFASMSIDKLSLFFCRLGFIGLIPKAPGTWASFFAAILSYYFFLALPLVARAILLLTIFLMGALAATRAELLLKKKDPGQVVIDELLGMWIALFFFSQASFTLIFFAFILFRFFDIAKIWPVKASENWLPAGFGIMIDDVLAGIQTLIVLFMLSWFFDLF